MRIQKKCNLGTCGRGLAAEQLSASQVRFQGRPPPTFHHHSFNAKATRILQFLSFPRDTSKRIGLITPQFQAGEDRPRPEASLHQMYCSDCFRGAVQEGQPRDRTVKLHGVDVYISEPFQEKPAKGSIVMIHDIMGWQFVNN